VARRSKTSFAPLDKSKIPKGVYWDNSGNGHWYKVFKDEGRPKRRKIAGSGATIGDLHNLMESGEINCLNWLASKFENSSQFKRVSKSHQQSYQYARGIVCNHPTKKTGIKLGQIPLTHWKPVLVQKLIDSVGEKNGPSAAKKVKEYLSRVFNWGTNRDYSTRNPVGKPEMPKERKRQRLPDKVMLSRLVAFARERGNQAKRKGSCAPYIWYTLEIARKCRLRGVEVFNTTDAHLLDIGIDCERRKGSRSNITKFDAVLEDAIEAALKSRSSIWRKKGQPIPFEAEDRVIIVGTSGQQIKPSTWQSAWKRFLQLAICEGVIGQDEWFGLHDMKRRGITDTQGNREQKMEASGHRSVAMLDVYDKSIPIVDAAPD